MRALDLVLAGGTAAAAALLPAVAQAPAVPRLPGLGAYSRPTGATAEAQRYFDQGLALAYGFNQDEALRAFEAAVHADPTHPMPHWGVALAYAPTVDRGRQAARDRLAREAIGRAMQFIDRARPADADLIRATAARWDTTGGRTGAQLDSAWARALADLWRRAPRDPEVGALYGEALMLLMRRHYWQHDGGAAPGTAEMLAAFEGAMRAAPNHLGANHYYIHALEMSHDPARALASAERLQTAAPGAGHLVHMGAHVFFRLGRYADAVRANQRARAADSALFALSSPPPGALYPAGYHLHTLHFLWMALAMEGRGAEALAAAEELARKVPDPSANASNYVHPWTMAPLFVLVRFAEWDRVLATPAPPAQRRFATAVWWYARGEAFAARGDTAPVAAAAAEIEQIASGFPPAANVAPLTPGKPLLESAARTLRARIHAVRGEHEAALALLARNVAAQDSAGMMEPPAWFRPAREDLGRAQLNAGRGADAEATFRGALEEQPGSPWALRGRAAALRALGRAAEAARVDAEARRAWARADRPPPEGRE